MYMVLKTDGCVWQNASTLALFRKRLSPESIMEANDYILNQDDDKKDPPSRASSEKRDCEKGREDAGNQGTLIIDAACAPANIRYPQDISLLNEERENWRRSFIGFANPMDCRYQDDTVEKPGKNTCLLRKGRNIPKSR